MSTTRPTFASRINRRELANGAKLLSIENHATPTVSLRGSLRAGSYFEPVEKRGLARLTAEMLERGTKGRTKLQIAEALESAGAEIDFSADQFAVNCYARSMSKDLPLVLETIAEELREPSFLGDELEKLKQQLIAEIQEQQSRTSHRAFERFSEIVFDRENPFYVPAGEELISSIGSTSVDDIHAFFEKQYGGRSLIVCVAGDINSDEAANRFENIFGNYGGPSSTEIIVNDPTPQPTTLREIVIVKEKANVDIVLGLAAPLRRNSADYYAAMIANNALGLSTLSSRLGLRVRDELGLTYGINSRFRNASLAAGPWTITVSVNPGNIELAIESSLEVVRKFALNGITDDELANEKSYATGSFLVSLATNAGLARALWNAEFFELGTGFVDRYPSIIDAITRDQVDDSIRKYFLPDQLTIVMAGDVKN